MSPDAAGRQPSKCSLGTGPLTGRRGGSHTVAKTGYHGEVVLKVPGSEALNEII